MRKKGEKHSRFCAALAGCRRQSSVVVSLRRLVGCRRRRRVSLRCLVGCCLASFVSMKGAGALTQGDSDGNGDSSVCRYRLVDVVSLAVIGVVGCRNVSRWRGDCRLESTTMATTCRFVIAVWLQTVLWSSDIPWTRWGDGRTGRPSQVGRRFGPWGLVQNPRAARMARAIFRRVVPEVVVHVGVIVIVMVPSRSWHRILDDGSRIEIKPKCADSSASRCNIILTLEMAPRG